MGGGVGVGGDEAQGLVWQGKVMGVDGSVELVWAMDGTNAFPSSY